MTVRRPRCPRCLRPQSAQNDACICRWARPVDVQTRVLMLQHPLEANNPKGSARLLHLSLPGSQLVVGEVFEEALLVAAMAGGADAHGNACWQPVLLYPADPADLSDLADSSAAVQPAEARSSASFVASDGRCICLVVLDGTWRKSRTMLQCNPVLQRLPRLSLQPSAPSRYTVRKAHTPDQRSTLEAACEALAQIEGAPDDKFDALLSAFDGFVAQQMGYRASPPPSVLTAQVNHP